MSFDHVTYRSPILITVSYFTLYYAFIIYQVITKYSVYFTEKKKGKEKEKEGEKEIKLKDIKYFSNNTLILAADRTVGNCLEQMVPFLSSLWLYAVFVSPEGAGYYGTIYVATRSYYPFVFRLGGGWLLLSTIPNYICIWIMLIKVFQAVL